MLARSIKANEQIDGRAEIATARGHLGAMQCWVPSYGVLGAGIFIFAPQSSQAAVATSGDTICTVSQLKHRTLRVFLAAHSPSLGLAMRSVVPEPMRPKIIRMLDGGTEPPHVRTMKPGGLKMWSTAGGAL